MASQILSGASNPSYTNNTGQNVRLVINHMSNTTQVSWAGNTLNLLPVETVHVASPNYTSSIYNRNNRKYYNINNNNFLPGPSTGYTINSTLKLITSIEDWDGTTYGDDNYDFRGFSAGSNSDSNINYYSTYPYNPTRDYTVGFSIPSKIFLAPGQSFSAVCGPYNIVVIKEDGN